MSLEKRSRIIINKITIFVYYFFMQTQLPMTGDDSIPST